MTILYWGTDTVTPIDAVCEKHGVRLIKSNEKLKKVYRLLKPDLVVLNTDAAPERKIRKYTDVAGSGNTFPLPVSRKLSLKEADSFLKKILGNRNSQIPIAAVHPYTDALLLGRLISQKNNFEWIPEDPYLISSLPENTKLRHCTLNNGEKLFTADFEFYSENGRYFLRSMIL